MGFIEVVFTTKYVNLLFILDYISAEDAISLMEEIELSCTYN